MPDRRPPRDHLGVTLTATTALPYPHLERATAGLRGALRQQLLAAGVLAAPNWSTLTVTGPQEFADERGQAWSGYWATLDSTTPDELAT